MIFNFSSLNNSLRSPLSAEIHSRPFLRLKPPECITHLAIFSQVPTNELSESNQSHYQLLSNLCNCFGVTNPSNNAKFFYHDFGRFRLQWELHTEFSTYTFSRKLDSGLTLHKAFEQVPISFIPQNWLYSLEGLILVGAHAVLSHGSTQDESTQQELDKLFGKSSIVGSKLGSRDEVWTDFLIHADGFSRFVICNVEFTDHQAGRSIQRILEIETYRMMALVGLPNAQKAIPSLNTIEAELSSISLSLVRENLADQNIHEQPPKKVDMEQILLQKIIDLAARLEKISLENNYRFSASLAYFKLVQARIQELNEIPFRGLPSIGEFMERRLVPAMNTCQSVGKRQVALAERIAHINDLLRTRVGLLQEQQNRQILQSLNTRASKQLLLQQSVEGLSVVAISYYTAGLFSYLGKAFKSIGLPINPDSFAGLSLPIIFFFVWIGMRQLHKKIESQNTNS